MLTVLTECLIRKQNVYTCPTVSSFPSILASTGLWSRTFLVNSTWNSASSYTHSKKKKRKIESTMLIPITNLIKRTKKLYLNKTEEKKRKCNVIQYSTVEN